MSATRSCTAPRCASAWGMEDPPRRRRRERRRRGRQRSAGGARPRPGGHRPAGRRRPAERDRRARAGRGGRGARARPGAAEPHRRRRARGRGAARGATPRPRRELARCATRRCSSATRWSRPRCCARRAAVVTSRRASRAATRSGRSWAGARTSPRRSCSRAASIGFLHGDRAEGGAPSARSSATRWRASPRASPRVRAGGAAPAPARAARGAAPGRQLGRRARRRAVRRRDRARAATAAPRPRCAGARRADARLRDLLTRREVDVLEHMVRGETNAEIARALVVSEGTIKFHVKNILRKLNASNRAEATSRYLRLSLAAGGLTSLSNGRGIPTRWRRRPRRRRSTMPP